jgi:hypothetical protein
MHRSLGQGQSHDAVNWKTEKYDSTGPGIRIDCADENQQKLTQNRDCVEAGEPGTMMGASLKFLNVVYGTNVQIFVVKTDNSA